MAKKKTKTTTIQISLDLKKELEKRKMHKADTYEDVIWDLIEDQMELSKETLNELEIARKEFDEGKTIPFEQIKKELGL